MVGVSVFLKKIFDIRFRYSDGLFVCMCCTTSTHALAFLKFLSFPLTLCCMSSDHHLMSPAHTVPFLHVQNFYSSCQFLVVFKEIHLKKTTCIVVIHIKFVAIIITKYSCIFKPCTILPAQKTNLLFEMIPNTLKTQCN